MHFPELYKHISIAIAFGAPKQDGVPIVLVIVQAHRKTLVLS